MGWLLVCDEVGHPKAAYQIERLGDFRATERRVIFHFFLAERIGPLGETKLFFLALAVQGRQDLSNLARLDSCKDDPGTKLLPVLLVLVLRLFREQGDEGVDLEVVQVSLK